MISPSKPVRALWVEAPRRAALRPMRLEAPGEDEVLVETLYSGISRGTESLVFSAAVPKSQYEAMRAPFQEGAFPYPVKYGYASVGRVQEGPVELKGRCVFCLYPHQSAYVVQREAVVPLPEGDKYLGFIFARAEGPEAVEAALRAAQDRLEIRIE